MGIRKWSIVILSWYIVSVEILSQTLSPKFTVFPLPKNINTQNQEFGPSLTSDGKTLYFYSKRNSNYTDLFRSRLINGKWSDPELMNSLNSPYDDQSPFVYGLEQFIIFSSNRDGSLEFQLPNGQMGVSRDLYYSEKIDGRWSKPATLSDLINSEEMEENPFLFGNDLYFTRYPFGDPGSAKIWKAPLLGNNLYPAEELPPPINIPGTSNFAAVVSKDGKYIYFSSNRDGGYGGYDLYRSKILPNGSYSEPENLGPEINTEGNEAYLIFSPADDSILFCRKNPNESYDIYAAKWDDDTPKEIEEPEVAKILPNKPNKKIQDPKEKNELVEKLEPEIPSQESIAKKPIKPIPKDDFPEAVNIAETLKTKKKLSLNSIQFEQNSSELKAESVNSLDAIADFLQEFTENRIKVTGHTDLTGDLVFNVQLSWDRAESVKKYLISKGVKAYRIHIEGKGSTQPLINGTTPEANRANRRTEFTLID
jgi:outer membrane protein OmpA-like peptidoglycan-associated protein